MQHRPVHGGILTILVGLALGCHGPTDRRGHVPEQTEIDENLPDASRGAPAFTNRDAPLAAPDAAAEASLGGPMERDGASDVVAGDDSAPEDASAAGAGVTDADPGASPVPCPPDLLRCETFEDGTLGPTWQFGYVNGGAVRPPSKGTVAVDATRGARGSTRAVRVIANASSSTPGSRVGITTTFEQPLERLWGRYYMYSVKAPTGGASKHGSLVEARPASSQNTWYSVAISGGGLYAHQWDGADKAFECKAYTVSAGNCTREELEASLVPNGRWFCLEFMFDGKSGTRPAEIHIDGKALKLPKRPSSSAWSTFAFKHLTIGLVMEPHDNPAWEFFIDDVALGAERIGCDR